MILLFFKLPVTVIEFKKTADLFYTFEKLILKYTLTARLNNGK